MSKVLKDTLSTLVETWDDPGDYPNAVASGPLPSYNYIAGMEGELVVELTAEELAEWKELEGDDSAIQDFITDTVDPTLPRGITNVNKWLHQLEGNQLTLWSEDVEGDLGELDDEPDYEPDYDRSDYYYDCGQDL
jgi:hypothetical protein